MYQMELSLIRADDELTHLTLNGRLDLPGVQAVELKFLAYTASRKKPAVVDMSGVTFVSSMGIRMLLSAAKNLRPAGAKIVVLNPGPIVDEALRTAGLEQILPMSQNLEEAIKLASAK